ncbi:MAG TPA: hypothetical protein VLA83_14330, partial [Candidatus Binatia bacterium]|nr:hypothetical protein [Candidatus Binatia bacterium]
ADLKCSICHSNLNWESCELEMLQRNSFLAQKKQPRGCLGFLTGEVPIFGMLPGSSSIQRRSQSNFHPSLCFVKTAVLLFRLFSALEGKRDRKWRRVSKRVDFLA